MHAVRIVQRKLGWREVGDEEDWEIYWTDTSVGIERIMKLTKTQVRKIHRHTPYMHSHARTHTCIQSCVHARAAHTRARTHTHTCTHSHTRTRPYFLLLHVLLCSYARP